MNFRKIIQRRMQRQSKGVHGVGDVNAVISASVNEGSSRSHVSTRSRQRIVQRSGRTDRRRSEKRAEEATRMSRPKVRETEAEPESAPGEDHVESTEDREPVTPPIDEDVAGSVNAALHEADE
jgi:hypothetical protein